MQPAAVNTPTDAQVEVVRSFDAPVNLVWKPFTEADWVCRWMLGPPGWTMPICVMDFRVGGKYQNVFRNEADGLEIAMAGDFREIETLRKIVQDEKHVVGDARANAEQNTVVTLTFQQTKRGTTVITLIEYASTRARDETLATGMGAAMEMGYRRIDDLLMAFRSGTPGKARLGGDHES